MKYWSVAICTKMWWSVLIKDYRAFESTDRDEAEAAYRKAEADGVPAALWESEDRRAFIRLWMSEIGHPDATTYPEGSKIIAECPTRENQSPRW